jgi:hypothetical protein
LLRPNLFEELVELLWRKHASKQNGSDHGHRALVGKTLKNGAVHRLWIDLENIAE